MDFIYDYNLSGTEQETLPAPGSPLIGTSVGNSSVSTAFAEDFTKKLTNRFSLLSNINKKTTNDVNDSMDTDQRDELAEQFAKLSIELIKQSEYETLSNPSPNNDLPNKLSKILNNSELLPIQLYENSIQSSLELLEKRNYLNPSKIDKVSEDYELIIQPGLLGSVSRNKLRSNIQLETLKENLDLLGKFESVYDDLKKLSDNINQLNSVNNQIIKDFKVLNSFNEKNFKQNEKFSLSKLKKLKDEKDEIFMKKNLLISFQKKFQLNEYEKYLLESSKDIESDTEDFFKSFKKAKEIYGNCYLLLSMDNPKIGLNIMNEMNIIIDVALKNMNFLIRQKIFQMSSLRKSDFQIIRNCIHAILNSLTKDDLMKDDEKLAIEEVVSLNANVKELVNSVIDSKCKLILTEFKNIIQENEHQIYSSANDPMRYIGDLLASIHSLIVGEKETLDFMFKKDSFNETDNSEDIFEVFVDIDQIESFILSKTIETLANPLKLQLEQVIRQQTDVMVVSQLYEAFALYKIMFGKQLEDDNSIISAIDALQTLLQERVFSILHYQQNKISNDLYKQKISDVDLQPSDWLFDYFSNIHDILKSLETPMIKSNFLNLNDEIFQTLIDLLIDKPLEFINLQVSNTQNLSLLSAKIFKINCLDLISNKIIMITSFGKKYEQINDLLIQETQETAKLVYDNLLKETNLREIENDVNKIYPVDKFCEDQKNHNENKVNFDIYEPLIYNEKPTLFNNESITKIDQAIQTNLPIFISNDVYFKVSQISSPNISNEIIEQSTLKYINFYEIFHSLVVIYFNNENTETKEKLLMWNDGEIATLLGIEKVYMQQQIRNNNNDDISEIDDALSGEFNDIIESTRSET